MDDLKTWLSLSAGEKYPSSKKKKKFPVLENAAYKIETLGKTKRQIAMEFIEAALIQDRASSYMYAKGLELGISRAYLAEMKRQLGVKGYQIGVNTYWTLQGCKNESKT